MTKIILSTIFLVISISVHADYSRQFRYIEELNGTFIVIDNKVFCTHKDTDYAYSFNFRGDTDKLIGLYLYNKNNDLHSKYKFTDWVTSGLLNRSKIFKKMKGNNVFPRFVSIRQSLNGNDDITFLKSFRNQDIFEIEKIDRDFKYSFISFAYAKVLTCRK